MENSLQKSCANKPLVIFTSKEDNFQEANPIPGFKY